ncbi:hypothetical protein FRC01_014521 [Tulasnella sp. 417]|nr:hypothetical protein FRC01_014521 [Tulasnella sp. 417]
MATPEDLSQVMAKLGFQNTRANRFIQLSLHYITDPPNADRLHRSRCPSLTPKKRTPKTNVSHNTTTEHSPRSKEGKRKKAVSPQAGEGADDPVELPVRYPPTPISHLPGVGRYALDSYRIFSPALSGGGAPRDEQHCLRNLLSPCDDSSEAKPEWKEVLPEDKELRKYLVSILNHVVVDLGSLFPIIF